MRPWPRLFGLFRRSALLVTALGLALALVAVLAVVLTRGGSASLRLEIMSLPQGSPARVTVVGPGGFRETVTATGVLRGLDPGTYTARAEPVSVGEDTYHPTAAEVTAQVDEGEVEEALVDYQVVVPGDTVVLDEAALDSLTEVDPDQEVLRFSESPTLSPGDVVVAGVSSQTPQGLLRRVVEVDPGGEVRTEQAALTDAVSRGELSVERPLPYEEVERQEALAPGVGFEEGSLVITLSGTSGGGLPIVCGPGVRVTATGRIELDPDFDFSASWGPFQGLKARATVTTEERADLSLVASGSADCSKSVELYRLYFTPITVFLGPVPVVLAPVLTVNLDLEGGVSSDLSFGAAQTATYTAGIAYDSGEVTPVREFESEFQRPKAEVSPLEVTAKASAGPRLDLLLYGVVGPSVDARGHLRLKVAPLERPWWELFGGLRASARISLDILAGKFKVKVAETNVIDWERRIRAAEGEPPFTPITEETRLELGAIGPIRVGMTLSEASAATGMDIVFDEAFYTYKEYGCGSASLQDGPAGLGFMVNGSGSNPVIVRIGVCCGFPGMPVPRTLTMAGVGVHSTEEDVLRAYPGDIRVEPHPYDSPTGHYLIHEPAHAEQFALIFETRDDLVTSFRAGFRDAVHLIEGCL